MNINSKCKKVKRYPDTFGELQLTGLLPNRDSEIKGAIVTIAKTNTIKRSANKLFPVENTYQDTSQTGMAREQRLRRETVIIGELKRKYEY